jgi:hypothetical protein
MFGISIMSAVDAATPTNAEVKICDISVWRKNLGVAPLNA